MTNLLAEQLSETNEEDHDFKNYFTKLERSEKAAKDYADMQKKLHDAEAKKETSKLEFNEYWRTSPIRKRR